MIEAMNAFALGIFAILCMVMGLHMATGGAPGGGLAMLALGIFAALMIKSPEESQDG